MINLVALLLVVAHGETALKSSLKPGFLLNRAALCAIHAVYLEDALKVPQGGVEAACANVKKPMHVKACAEYQAHDCKEFDRE